MEEKYNELRHYGVILKDEEFNFEKDGVYIRMQHFELNGEKFLVIKKNGEVVHIEQYSFK